MNSTGSSDGSRPGARLGCPDDDRDGACCQRRACRDGGGRMAGGPGRVRGHAPELRSLPAGPPPLGGRCAARRGPRVRRRLGRRPPGLPPARHGRARARWRGRGRHRRLLLGTGVLLLPMRHPVWTAKQVATVDALAPDRVLLGVGVGGENPAEWEAAGVPVGRAGPRLDESLAIVGALLRGEAVDHPGPLLPTRAPVLEPVPAARRRWSSAGVPTPHCAARRGSATDGSACGCRSGGSGSPRPAGRARGRVRAARFRPCSDGVRARHRPDGRPGGGAGRGGRVRPRPVRAAVESLERWVVVGDGRAVADALSDSGPPALQGSSWCRRRRTLDPVRAAGVGPLAGRCCEPDWGPGGTDAAGGRFRPTGTATAMAAVLAGRTLLDSLDAAVRRDPTRSPRRVHPHHAARRHALTRPSWPSGSTGSPPGCSTSGVRAGQVVSAQLPNWWQLSRADLACLRVGAVTNALMPIFRQPRAGVHAGARRVGRCSWCPRSSTGSTTPRWPRDLPPGCPR